MTATNVSLSTDRTGDGAVIARVSGEINFAASPMLRASLCDLLKAKPARLVIDLGGVPYMDSSGVATLVEALQSQTRNGGKLVLCGLQPRVFSIFEISRLTTVFKIADDAQAATKA